MARPPRPANKARPELPRSASPGGRRGRSSGHGAVANHAAPRGRRSTRAPVGPPPIEPLADLTATITPLIFRAVLNDHQRLVPSVAGALASKGKVTNRDRSWILKGLAALFRWWGWIEPLQLRRAEEQLLLAWLLDAPEMSAIARVWATRLGRPPDGLYLVGDAPGWTARADGLKRFVPGRPVNADPWRLVPDWVREQLPVPPGDATPKARRLDFLAALQAREPLWVAVRAGDPKRIWNELRDAEVKPWIHRRLLNTAKLPLDTDISAIPACQDGRLVAQDLSSQAVGLVCDPDPGERWWDVSPENGLHALHLATLMQGKGVVVSTFDNERRRKETALRLRGFPVHNVTTRAWDGQHPPGKPGGFHGVLVDADCSGIGHWRRHPEARWLISAGSIPELVAIQLQTLDQAASRVAPGGTLVYTVATVTRAETVGVIGAFLESHPDFQLEPFPHPLDDETTSGTLQLWPQIHDSDARFIARMVKTPGAGSSPKSSAGGSGGASQ